ncbi:FecR family protein [Tenacibaculum sp. MEBiC06402]|uniref:FecR family protein n=1 Tax=unclassified Tenacibaculum TaxID=2635139 RepID=UPI003B9CD0EB
MNKESIIQKWLNNDLNSEEQKFFDSLEDKPLLEEILAEAKRFKNQNPYDVLPFDEIEKNINREKSSLKTKIYFITKIAAAFLIGFVALLYFMKDDYKNYETTIAQKEIIALPDKSQVTLNGSSKLSYNHTKWNKERLLTLEGEAFFDVEKGKRFVVQTSQGIVSVLGTEFNVEVRDSIFNVVCYEGLVSVIHNNKEIKLPAGKAFSFSGKNGVLQYHIVEAQPYWLQNMSVFEKVDVAKVFEAIEKQFQIEIIYNKTDVIVFTGAFENNNVQKALNSVTKPLNLSYEIQNDGAKVIITNAKE